MTTKEPPRESESRTLQGRIEIETMGDLGEQWAEKAALPAAEDSSPWRQELSERVQSFRQRRARLRNEPGPQDSLDFEFEARKTSEPSETAVEPVLEFPTDFLPVDAEIMQREALEDFARPLETETSEEDEAGLEIPESPPIQTDEIAIDTVSPHRDRLAIVIGPSEVDAEGNPSQSEFQALPVAPLGRRVLAGVVDGLVLLLGAGLFALIFWRAGGHLTPVPPNLAVVMLIAVIFIWTYFGLFTALTCSTPGLTCMGIEVRSMEGEPPSLRESLLRAFGYLVSISALMIGFLWALVDAEGLTWHDRISGTFLIPVNQEAPDEGLEST